MRGWDSFEYRHEQFIPVSSNILGSLGIEICMSEFACLNCKASCWSLLSVDGMHVGLVVNFINLSLICSPLGVATPYMLACLLIAPSLLNR